MVMERGLSVMRKKAIKFVLLGIACLVAVVAILMVVGFVDYRRSLRPVLVCTKPVADCAVMTFGYFGDIEMGTTVEKLVPSFDPAKSLAFAVRGKKAVRFVPEEFHGVYGKLQLEPGDGDTVYVYVCDKRYLQMIVAP
jgi:hypothetical protein